MKGTITVTDPDNKSVAFKDNAPIIHCISEINGIQIDNAEDLDVVMPMYNLLGYSKNYKKTTSSLWNYYRDEPSDPLFSNSESFKYKTSITGNAYYGDDDANKVGKNETEIVLPLKHLSNFWRTLNIPLTNCEIELILTWAKNCSLPDMTARAARNNNDQPIIVAPTGLEFQITERKLYVPVVTSSTENDKKLLEKLESGLKKEIKWNNYRSQMTIQSNNNNLNYLVDPTFTKVNRLFVLSFDRIEENNFKKDHRDSFSRYYVPHVEIKDFNVLIDGKRFFDLPVKNEEEANEKIIEMNRNNDYTTGNLLDLAYFKEHYRPIAIYLSKQTKLRDPQQISFIGKLENQAHGATTFFIIEKSKETTFEFLQNSVNILKNGNTKNCKFVKQF